MKIHTLDLEYGDTPQTIASFLVEGPKGTVLVETGPASTLDTLLARLADHGLEPADIQHVLVTHIHLDHAGAAGWWAQQDAKVYVHALGAEHLIDPTKLLASAERIYGDQMDAMWGETLPAPSENVVKVEDGDVIAAGGLEFEAVSTPGHARHHHAFLSGETLFAGDIAGIQLPDMHWIDLPAPPPEFDLEAWRTSLDRLRGLEIETLYRTHFGPTTEVTTELDLFESVLVEAAGGVGEMMAKGLDRAEMIERYNRSMREQAAAAGIDQPVARAYEVANPRSMSVDGMTRYWHKRAEKEADSQGEAMDRS